MMIRIKSTGSNLLQKNNRIPAHTMKLLSDLGRQWGVNMPIESVSRNYLALSRSIQLRIASATVLGSVSKQFLRCVTLVTCDYYFLDFHTVKPVSDRDEGLFACYESHELYRAEMESKYTRYLELR